MLFFLAWLLANLQPAGVIDAPETDAEINALLAEFAEVGQELGHCPQHDVQDRHDCCLKPTATSQHHLRPLTVPQTMRALDLHERAREAHPAC